MPASPLVKIHEDRITRLEEDVTECRIDLGVVKSQVMDIREQVADGFAMLSSKLDAIGGIDERVAALETMNKIEAEVKERQSARRGRRMKVLGLLVAIASATGGILGKLLFGG